MSDRVVGLRIKLGPLGFELSEAVAENATFTLFCTMISASVLAALVLFG